MRGLSSWKGRLLAAGLACVFGAAFLAAPATQAASAQDTDADAGTQEGASCYTVTFAANGGSAVAAQQVSAGGVAQRPADPVKAGFTLVGWYSDSACTVAYDFSKPVNDNLILWAKWAVATFTVSFDGGEVCSVDAQTVEYGKTVSQPTDPKVAGKTFLGWYSDAAFTRPYDFSQAVYHDTTLYAKWATKVLGVRFVTNGGTKVAAQDVEYGKLAVRPQADPEREGYAFVGWYADADLTQEFDFSAPITANVKVYARWARLYTVTFESNGGTEVGAQTVAQESAAQEPDEPERAGYSFAGWCSDKLLSCAYDFASGVQGNITLYAKWVKDVSDPIAFDDLVEPWSFTWVEQASARGLMNGYDDGAGNLTGRFYPSLNISRGQVAMVLWRIAGSPATSAGGAFPDVAQGKYYAHAIAWCAEQGIVTGYEKGAYAGTFRPDAEVSREELATMVYRFAAWAGVTTKDAPLAAYQGCIDTDLVSDWSHDAMVWCAAAGVISGKDTDQGLRLDPQVGATRAQAAKVFVQLDKLADGETYPYDDTDGTDTDSDDPDSGDTDDASETPTRPSGSKVDISLTYGVTADGFSYVVVPEDYADADGYAYVLDQAYDELGGKYVGAGAYITGYTGSASTATLPVRISWPVKVEGPSSMTVSGSIAGPFVVSANLSWDAADGSGHTRLTSLSVAGGAALVQLNLAGNLVDGVTLSGEGGLGALRFLDLSDTQTQGLDTSALPALEQLGLARCPLAADALESLTSWRGVTGLPADLTDAGQTGDGAGEETAADEDVAGDAGDADAAGVAGDLGASAGEAVGDDAFDEVAADDDGLAEVTDGFDEVAVETATDVDTAVCDDDLDAAPGEQTTDDGLAVFDDLVAVEPDAV